MEIVPAERKIRLMKMKLILQMAALLAAGYWLQAAGLPEPGVVFYGRVQNSGGGNELVTVGSVNWSIRPTGGEPISLSAPLANINGSHSYRLRVPFETVVGGNTASTASFVLTGAATQYSTDVNNVSISSGGTNYPANVGVAFAVANFNSSVRGVVQELDLSINAPGLVASSVIAGGSLGRPERIAASLGYQPGDTFPWFTHVTPNTEGGIDLAWTGILKDRNYLLIRAQAVESDLSKYEVVHQFNGSSATANSFRDTNTVNTITYFYKLLFQ